MSFFVEEDSSLTNSETRGTLKYIQTKLLLLIIKPVFLEKAMIIFFAGSLFANFSQEAFCAFRQSSQNPRNLIDLTEALIPLVVLDQHEFFLIVETC